jgi:hypothetical protein
MYSVVFWRHVPSALSDMDPFYHMFYILQSPLIGEVPIFVRYRVAFPTPFLPHLQLCHFTVHARLAVTSAVKANSHTPWRSPAALIHSCQAATLSFSDSATIFVKVRVIDGNIRTASLLLVTTFMELRVVAGRSRTLAGRPHAVSRQRMLIYTYHADPMPRCAVALRSRFQNGMAWERHGRGMAYVKQTRPHCVYQMGKSQSKPLAERHGRGMAWERHGMCELALSVTLRFSQRYWRRRRRTLEPGGRPPGWSSAYYHAAVPTGLEQALNVNSMSQYPMIIRSQLSSALRLENAWRCALSSWLTSVWSVTPFDDKLSTRKLKSLFFRKESH